MQQFGHNRHGPKIGGCAPLGGAGSPPHLTQCGGAEAYLRVKFHLDPYNRLATIHQRHRQTDRQTETDRQTQTDNGPIAYGEPFYKRSPKKCSRFDASEITHRQ